MCYMHFLCYMFVFAPCWKNISHQQKCVCQLLCKCCWWWWWCVCVCVCVCWCAACLPVLHTLQITHNRLQSVADIEHLVLCESIGVLDLSYNQLHDPLILDVFKRMKSLVGCFGTCNCLLMTTRRVMCGRCKHIMLHDKLLKYVHFF